MKPGGYHLVSVSVSLSLSSIYLSYLILYLPCSITHPPAHLPIHPLIHPSINHLFIENKTNPTKPTQEQENLLQKAQVRTREDGDGGA